MKITIDKKAFELKFGFKCMLNLGEALGLKTFNEVANKFANFGQNEDFELEQLNLIEKLVIAAAEAHPNYYNLEYSILDVSVLDYVMTNPKVLQQIMTEFSNSFPKGEGKPQPRKQARKTKA